MSARMNLELLQYDAVNAFPPPTTAETAAVARQIFQAGHAQSTTARHARPASFCPQHRDASSFSCCYPSTASAVVLCTKKPSALSPHSELGTAGVVTGQMMAHTLDPDGSAPCSSYPAVLDEVLTVLGPAHGDWGHLGAASSKMARRPQNGRWGVGDDEKIGCLRTLARPTALSGSPLPEPAESTIAGGLCWTNGGLGAANLRATILLNIIVKLPELLDRLDGAVIGPGLHPPPSPRPSPAAGALGPGFTCARQARRPDEDDKEAVTREVGERSVSGFRHG
ncbi:hypothetical protein B0H63DRAFT_529791 [Podospora didyma]|uniref:Uncharacterized protein n=1 Tax=Podospora didyma TaxID=330526 RepID=A0AAE0JXZ2_9PEZI|nr:hypothetical protein B0H63DRAFT_529791 [Podospora didyma]